MEPAPRYRPLRALPAYAYVPGRSERPAVDLEPAASEADYLPAERWAEHGEYLWGADLYNAGFFWEAHEAWEGAWRAAEHDLVQHAYLQGLIQCAAACLKGVLADTDSARRIAARALDRLEGIQMLPTQAARDYMGLDLARFCAAFRSFIARDPTDVAARPLLILSSRRA
ncbi:MAG TPA: DUF309 domain-containing protein [Polyangiales bacterium]|nr:DUF309 domain-containing protein [Polyangiales bacterium]